MLYTKKGVVRPVRLFNSTNVTFLYLGGSPTATCTNSVMCANGGICKVQSGLAACFCDYTSFTGSTCQNGEYTQQENDLE